MGPDDARHTVTLKCPNCGGNLAITPDLEVFACGYCGTQQVVRRSGNTVSLKLIGDAIAGVKAGTDRIAAEMELRRLRDDLADIDKEGEKVEQEIGKIRGTKEQRESGCGKLFVCLV